MNELELLRNQISSRATELVELKSELAEANDRAFCSTESHVRTMQKLQAAEKDRDIYATSVEDMAAAHKVERDALKDAARMALDALYAYEPCIKKFGLLFGTGSKAIATLKAVL